jgi:phenylpropionate dioxygenase-like ring-hydroxylating dioxygenase large terminal subunit
MPNYPFSPFPNGWFQVAYSDEVRDGEVLPIHYFGKELVLFRTSSGQAQVLDAHCPHLGAHLGHGGSVENDCLRCPFHGWSFGPDGKCQSIPYSNGKIPARAQLRSWPVQEVNGTIMVWHHAQEQQPDCDVPVAAQLSDPDYVHLGRFRWQYPTHLQEMVDNAADPLHLVHLHGVMMPATSATEQPAGRDLRLTTRFISDPTRIGIPGEPFPACIESLLHGFGMQIIRFDAMAEGLIHLCFTPIDGEQIDARMTISLKRLPDEAMTRFVGDLVVKDVTRQFEEDITIWKHKIYRDKPVLCDNDGPIGLVRRWSRQFYPSLQIAG